MASPSLSRKEVDFSNLLLGASLNLFEVTTLGQPLEVIKTTMAAHRGDSFAGAMQRCWSRGGLFGFWQGLIPWAWIEASTKGAVLMFASSEADYAARRYLNASPLLAGMLGGMTGGVAQAYLSVGFCTCMKTVEITRQKQMAAGVRPPSSMRVFADIFRAEGLRGVNRGVNAVAVRQCTNWGSRFALARLAEDVIRRVRGRDDDYKLSAGEKVLASALGGGLSTWNQPIEVARIEMQSRTPDPLRPKNLTALGAIKYVYQQNGLRGLYRGVTPRIGLGCWQTVCMVGLGDMAKDQIAKFTGRRPTGH